MPSILSTLQENSQPGSALGVHDSRNERHDIGQSSNTPTNPALLLDPALQGSATGLDSMAPMNGSGASVTRESSTGSGMFGSRELQNPSDALGILATLASHGENANSYYYPPSNASGHSTIDYPMVRDNRLSVTKIVSLLQRYKL
jgi:hypothetical protein